MELKTYTISVYSENNIGLLNRISAIFLKRHINLESFSTSESEIPDVFRFVIVVNIAPDKVHKIVQQIEKQIDVIKLIKFLLKDKGMTINGVKNALKNKINKLDDYDSISLQAQYHKRNVKLKSKKILDKINKLKSYGKKNSS